MSAKNLKAVSWLTILSLVIATIVPAEERPVSGLQPGLEHFLAFAFAGLTFGFAYTRSLRANLLSAIVFTLALELSQIPLPSRHARLGDFAIDAAASCLGIAIAYVCRKLIRNRLVVV